MENPAEICLRPFDSAVEEGYRRLFPGEPDKAPDLLEWRFRDNPHGPAKFATAADGNAIVGMIALVPTRLANTSADFGYQAIDTAVHPSQRGKGLFVRMGDVAQTKLGGDVLWGFPNASAAPGWYGRLGWTNFGTVPLLMRPLRSGFLLGRVHPRFRVLDFSLVLGRKSDAHVYGNGEDLAHDFDRLWRSVSPSFHLAVDRSGPWMRWRLFDKPGANYRCVGIRGEGGALAAFVSTKIVEKHGAQLCYVMEAKAADGRGKDLSRLLRSELSRAARGGAEAALAWCPRFAPNRSAYRNAGFVPMPNRLRPIEINFGAKALQATGGVAAAADAKWYVSFLDSDTN